MLPLDSWRALCEHPLPQPNEEELRAAAEQIQDLLFQDFAALPDRVVGRTASRDQMEKQLREPPPDLGQPLDQILADLKDKVMPYVLRPQHPRFVAFIPGAPTQLSMLGDWLCAGLNYFCGVWKEAPAASQIEILVLDWFKEFLGMPRQARGVLTSGGSEANLTALVAARETLPNPDRQRAILYFSEHRHWSIDRAAKIMGLHQCQLRPISTDDLCRLIPAALTQAIAQDRDRGLLPWLVVANAGATNTGSVDPLPELANLCQRERIWLHVDAAYGWPAALTSEGRRELQGIDRADSITLDPHKWFAQTFEVGCVLVREGRHLTDAFMLRPDYMQDVVPDKEEINFADHGIALTRRFRALKIWFSLKGLGMNWHRRLIEHCCRLADYSQVLLEQAGWFEILCPRQLSILCFRWKPGGAWSEIDLDNANLALCEACMESGRAFLSTTRLRGRVALRLCFVNFRTRAADVEEIIQTLTDFARKWLQARNEGGHSPISWSK